MENYVKKSEVEAVRKFGLIKKISSVSASFIISLSCSTCFGNVFAEDGISPYEQNIIAQMTDDYYSFSQETTEQIPSYCDYYDTYCGFERPDSEIIINGCDYISAKNGDFSNRNYENSADKVLVWNSSSGEVEYRLDIKKSGIYCINMTYLPIVAKNTQVVLSLKIDGLLPFDTANRITLNKVWKNKQDIFTDSRGNQVRPSQIQTEMWLSSDLCDTDGLYAEPLIFYLEKGCHTISFSSEKANIAIENIKLYNPEKLTSYADYHAQTKASVTIENTPSNLIRLEGENADFKSDSVLSPTYDNTNYNVSPSNPTKVIYNTIGKESWKKAFQSLTWTIRKDEIQHDGWYKIGIKARQNYLRGFCTSRRVYIDGKVPCDELNRVNFFYDSNWKLVSPKTADGNFIYVYLTADCDHSITLEAVPSEICDSMRKIDDIIVRLNTCYRKILMITGPTPDKNTDYYVHEKIPELIDEFSSISADLKQIQSEIESLSSTIGSEAAALGRITVILDKCVKKPLKIPEYLSQIKDNITTISAWTREYREQPLELDYIELASADKKFTSVDESFFEAAKFSFDAFIGSFFEDYSTLSDISSEKAVEVWVNSGRDQAQIIKQLAESDFMQETGIPVAVNLVNGGIIEAALAGEAPDTILFLGGEFPVILASRGLLTDLSQLDGYNETAAQFAPNATVQYSYNGGVYGIPLSQQWAMMFCRKDVLADLGISKPPETWDELIGILPEIQRNYMSVGLVLPPANTSPATECGHTFATLMLQQGLTYYNDDLSASTLNRIEAVKAFEMWTDFYSEYGFVQSYDAFSRFRTGEFPIVISNYTFYNQLTASSPEINGLWRFYPVPATVRDDGSISHATNSNGTGAVIFNSSENKENAWKFIKWFSSSAVQTEYAHQIEGMLGTLGRFDTANTEALANLSWSDSELKMLTAQRNELAEIPIIPASYAVTRNIMNAFRDVVNLSENPRDTLIWYNNDINEEISRKNSQF